MKIDYRPENRYRRIHVRDHASSIDTTLSIPPRHYALWCRKAARTCVDRLIVKTALQLLETKNFKTPLSRAVRDRVDKILIRAQGACLIKGVPGKE